MQHGSVCEWIGQPVEPRPAPRKENPTTKATGSNQVDLGGIIQRPNKTNGKDGFKMKKEDQIGAKFWPVRQL